VDVVTDRLAATPVWVAVGTVVAALVTLSAVGAVVLWAERWYGYLLLREQGGDGTALRVRRGLLTRRSLSVAEARLRGAEVSEPLLLRAGGGAQAGALSTGLERGGQGGALQPPVPRAEALRVASAALREPPAEIVAAPLLPHPPAARTRRLSRALVPAAAVAVALGLLLPPGGWLGLLLLPAAALLGLDRARSLGHALTARHVVVREGSLVRRTVALRREGVLGWTVRQSPFQRRAGLVTVEAVTAAGAGGYRVLDIGAVDGVRLADAATPGLLPRPEEDPCPAS
jgi:putative membrane protein